MSRSEPMRLRLGRAELLAAAVIVGSAFVYWMRAGVEPGIVFHGAPSPGAAAAELSD